MNINPAYQPAELKYCLNKVGVKAIVAAETFKTQNYHAIMAEAMPELANTPRGGQLASKEVPSLKHVIVMSKKNLPGALKFCEVMEAGKGEDYSKMSEMARLIQMDDPCNIQFTSVSIGRNIFTE